jgi:hypothetical protein
MHSQCQLKIAKQLAHFIGLHLAHRQHGMDAPQLVAEGVVLLLDPLRNIVIGYLVHGNPPQNDKMPRLAESKRRSRPERALGG